MADKKISELDLVAQINNDAEFPMSQDNAGTPTTYKTKLTDIGAVINEDMTFSNLATRSKKTIGAINEIFALGSAIIVGTSAPTSSQGSNGNIYVQYTAGTGGADDTVDALFVKIDGEWCEIETGGGSGSGGHTIVDDDGTSLTQRTNLQFIGAYSNDNSTDDTTEINVVREMTKAQFNQLTAAEKTGLINITDESLNATEIPITDGSQTNTKAYIDGKTGSDIEWEANAGVSISVLIRHLLMTEQTDLNSSLNAGTATPRITYYPSTASNRPSGNSGIVITQGNGTYRQQLAIDLEGNIYVRYYNNGTISSWKNNAGVRTDIRSLVTFNETVTGTNTQFYVKAGVLYVLYQGESKAHSATDLLFTLPSDYRPTRITYATFVASNGVNYIFGDVSIDTNGECRVNQISDSSGAGRIYFTCAIPLA